MARDEGGGTWGGGGDRRGRERGGERGRRRREGKAVSVCVSVGSVRVQKKEEEVEG